METKHSKGVKIVDDKRKSDLTPVREVPKTNDLGMENSQAILKLLVVGINEGPEHPPILYRR
jgi:hypothetical protein